MAWWDALLGKLFWNDQELELRGALNFRGLDLAPLNDENGDPVGWTFSALAPDNGVLTVDGCATAAIPSLVGASVLVDGVTHAEGSRILLPFQDNATEVGVYQFGPVTSGTANLARTADASTTAAFTKMLVGVSGGSFYGGTLWLQTKPAPVVGVDDIAFSQIGRDPAVGVPNQSEPVDISSTDHTFAIVTTGIRIGGSGNMYAKFRGDSAFQLFVVTAGEVVDGDFVAVQKTSTTATNMLGLTRT